MANLSDFYLETFKDHWATFDHDAKGIIPLKSLVMFLARIKLPFKSKSLYKTIGQMYLPIIRLKRQGEDEIKSYFLFQDIMSAITHMSTTKKVKAHELKKMNMKNALCMEIENARYNQMEALKEGGKVELVDLDGIQDEHHEII